MTAASLKLHFNRCRLLLRNDFLVVFHCESIEKFKNWLIALFSSTFKHIIKLETALFGFGHFFCNSILQLLFLCFSFVW